MDIFLPCEAKGICWQHVSDAAFRVSVPNSWVSEVKGRGVWGPLEANTEAQLAPW